MKEIKIITKIADLEAEIIELENLCKKHPESIDVGLWRKELKSLRTQHTKLVKKLFKDDIDAKIEKEFIKPEISDTQLDLIDGNISLADMLKINELLRNEGRIILKFKKPVYAFNIDKVFDFEYQVKNINRHTLSMEVR